MEDSQFDEYVSNHQLDKHFWRKSNKLLMTRCQLTHTLFLFCKTMGTVPALFLDHWCDHTPVRLEVLLRSQKLILSYLLSNALSERGIHMIKRRFLEKNEFPAMVKPHPKVIDMRICCGTPSRSWCMIRL